jgi:dimeric dUTPase (all-alpha-NTP-PPase superfamily)
MKKTQNYETLKTELFKLLLNDESWLTETELAEVNGFIEVGEFGLAFEAISDIINEEEKSISTEVFCRLVNLGELMNFSYAEWERLRPFVIEA